MSAQAAAIPAGGYNKGKLFLLSVVALTTSGMVFSIRTNILEALQKTFFDQLDPFHAAQMVGAVAGVAFLGFAISVFLSSPLCDYLGMGRLLGLASLLHIGGTLVIVFAQPLSERFVAFWVLWFGMLVVGLAHGLVEAVINPLVATLYPDDKTHKLNVLHVWWPGGLIIGGLIGYIMGKFGLSWQLKQATILIPSLIYLVMIIGTKFPPTERKAAGVSGKEMWGQALRPMFIVLWLSMFLTAASELGAGQWVDAALTRTIGFQGILLLVYVSGLMFVMRHFAGPLAHKLSPIGLLWLSCLLASLGLVSLSYANTPILGILGATVWGVGVCYMWPTMLAVNSERFPKGGAVLMGLMGTAGNLSVYVVMPLMGRVIDAYKIKALPAGVKWDELMVQVANKVPGAKAIMDKALAYASPYAFRYLAALPAVLILVFGIFWLRDRARGGYKVEKLG